MAPDLHDFQKDYLQDGQQPIELPIPKCYHARYSGGDESPVESVLVLENLKSTGYDVMEFSRGLTLDQTRSALAAVAKLHALSLVMKVSLTLCVWVFPAKKCQHVPAYTRRSLS